jgi:HSP20 family protein
MATRWDPFRDALSLREAMDRLLEESFVRPRERRGGERGQVLPIDMWETEDSLIVRAPMPGAKPEADDIDINVEGGVLTLRVRLPGAADEEEGTSGRGIRWIHREVPRGEMSRTVELPIPVDSDRAAAHFGAGLLELTLPKAEVAKPKQIKITGGA